MIHLWKPLFLVVVFICNYKVLYGETVVAFSLREADALLGNSVSSDELQYLSGITRVSGMVHDRASGDIIVVGKRYPDLPQLRLEDLCVALRSRMTKNADGGVSPPSVSIDMSEKTDQTNEQVVVFGGGIENTLFGETFLECDIFLKEYSLELIDRVPGIESYMGLFSQKAIEDLRRKGAEIDNHRWLGEAESIKMAEELKNKAVTSHTNIQTRFWYNVNHEASGILDLFGVYFIRELHIQVSRETTLFNNDGSQLLIADAGEEFSRLFTQGLTQLSQKNPSLQRLKGLYDLTCIATGIIQLGSDRPMFSRGIVNSCGRGSGGGSFRRWDQAAFCFSAG